MMKRYDNLIALAVILFTLTMAYLLLTNREIMQWVFARHANKISWYIRPLFFIPLCYFSYKRSLAGISLTILCQFTSLFWFHPPAVVDDNVKAFLAFEQDWLNGAWHFKKCFQAAAVPVSFFVLCLAFWKRSLTAGLILINIIAIGKILWSTNNSKEGGIAVIVPALVGLLICSAIIYVGFTWAERKHQVHYKK